MLVASLVVLGSQAALAPVSIARQPTSVAPQDLVIENLELALGGFLVLAEDFILLPVSEGQQGHQDLDGNGQVNGEALFILEPSSGQLVNLHLPVRGGSIQADGDWAGFLVRESLYSETDLNQDGDTQDDVLFLYEHRSGSWLNTHLGVSWPNRRFAIRGGYLVVPVSEESQGRHDLNADGDVEDDVLHYVKLPSSGMASVNSIVNSRLADLGYVLDPPVVVVNCFEFLSGFGDLNGDGDNADVVLQCLDLRTGAVINTRLAEWSYSDVAVEYPFIAVPVTERGQGQQDLNGDGDVGDSVLHVFDIRASQAFNLALACLMNATVVLQDGLARFHVDEAFQGADIDGDGSRHDKIPYLYDAGSHALEGLGVAGFFMHDPHGPQIGYVAEEDSPGAGDLNGNGVISGYIVQVLDRIQHVVRNTGLAAGGAGLDSACSTHCFVGVHESDQGPVDLNSDGGYGDFVLHSYRYGDGFIRNYGVAMSPAYAMARAGKFVAFSCNEASDGARDWNFDGDVHDDVLFLVDDKSGELFNLGFACAFASKVAACGSQVFFVVDEREQGHVDLNGDGDANDTVLHRVRIRDAADGL